MIKKRKCKYLRCQFYDNTIKSSNCKKFRNNEPNYYHLNDCRKYEMFEYIVDEFISTWNLLQTIDSKIKLLESRGAKLIEKMTSKKIVEFLEGINGKS